MPAKLRSKVTGRLSQKMFTTTPCSATASKDPFDHRLNHGLNCDSQFGIAQTGQLKAFTKGSEERRLQAPCRDHSGARHIVGWW